MVSGSFNLRLRILFIFPSPYLCAIGLEVYLGLGVTGSRIPNGSSTIGTLDTRYQPSSVLLRDYHPLP